MLKLSATGKTDRYSLISGHEIKGGLKQAALERWLPTLNQNHFEYAGSVYGLGGLALAHACNTLGFTSTLHIAEGKYKPKWLETLPALNCKLVWHAAKPVEDIHKQLSKPLPLGFDDAGFINAMAETIKQDAEEIWFPIVSGTIAKAVIKASPRAQLHGVKVAKFTPDFEGVTLYQAPEKYHQVALTPPPYPAYPFSDAKIWQFFQQNAGENAVIINTGFAL
ncbi:MAG: hypothetical protein GC136_09440 [Alphaproteobacteria bacterium]|nr:hypothetical protein [Alphaproteobacteria bacterium]